MKAIDCGCGVGGPMRTIAKASGAHVTGITINEYQVKRARAHNQNAGLATQCTVVQGNFLALPFPAATFDAACVPPAWLCVAWLGVAADAPITMCCVAQLLH
jgi:ubiquinone/menaquinone biosynthesis C-methylase UbiE